MLQSASGKVLRPLSSRSYFKIHQPLPLTPRESKQLLELLTSSFRRQLDRQHPVASSQSKISTRQADSSVGPRRPTDAHFSSILRNPLFSKLLHKCDHQEDQRNPMQVFDEACSRGLMTLGYARACLVAKKDMIRSSSAITIAAGMKESGAGAKVLKWMSDNGFVKADIFLQNEALLAILIEYMVAEGLEDIVWVWTKEAIERASKTSRRDRRLQETTLAENLVHHLVAGQAQASLTRNGAYQTICKTEAQLRRRNVNPHEVLRKAGLWLSYQTCMREDTHLPPADNIYDLFVNTLSSFSANSERDRAHLALKHPTRPDAGKALEFLKRFKREESKEQPKTGSKRIIALALDAAKVLHEQNMYKKAKWVMDYLQETFPEELGLNKQAAHDFELAKAEAETLELLKSLNLT